MLFNVITIFIIALVIYNILSINLFSNLNEKYGFLKNSRRDYYECGFRPMSQNPINISIQYLLLVLFFITYDIELTLVVPAMGSFIYLTLFELMLLLVFIFFFLLSFLIDFENHALNWQV